MKSTTQLYPVPRLRMSEAIPLPPLYTFIAENFTFFHLKVKSMKQCEGVDLTKVVLDRVQQEPFVNMVITCP